MNHTHPAAMSAAPTALEYWRLNPAEPPLDRRFLRRLRPLEKLSAHQKRLLRGTH